MKAKKIAALLAVLASLPVFPAAAQTADEISIKAAFLTRFGAFTSWPPSVLADPTSPLNVCVLGQRRLFEDILRAARASQGGGRPIVPRYLSSSAERRGCHVLYIANTTDQDVAESLAAVRREPILTVTDERNGSERGAIHFVTLNERVRFHVDLRHTESRDLHLNARLLAIAVSVRGNR